MRVLVLHSELGVLRGGGENFTRNLFVAFAERGHSVAAAFVADRQKQYPIALPSNILAIPLEGWWSRNFGQAALSAVAGFLPDHGLKNKWDHLRSAISWRVIGWHNRRFQRAVEDNFSRRWNDFDAVYVHGDVALAAAVANHRPTVLRLPGPVAPELEPDLRAAHAVCANGDALLRVGCFLKDHVVELPVGVDDQLFKPGCSSVRSRLSWPRESKVVGYVGRLTRLKGVDLFAAAFHEVSKHLPNARILIVGSGEEERNLRSALADEFDRKMLHIERDVSHAQLPQWYRAMDVLVMPSRYENFSNALIEGMACGVPFVASNVGGNRILAKTGAGWLFEPESVSSLSKCLQMILQNTNELRGRRKIGFDYVKQHHNWAATAQCLEEILVSRLGVTDV